MYFITTKRMLEVCFFQHTPTFIIEPFFAPIRLYRTLKKSKRTVGSPARTTKVRLRGQRETGGFLLNLLCKDESPDVP